MNIMTDIAAQQAEAALIDGQQQKRLRRYKHGPPVLREPNGSPPVEPEGRKWLPHGIRQQLAEIEQIYQHAPVGLFLIDRNYRYVRINECMAQINGLPVEAHIGRTLREVRPELADQLIELYRPIYDRGQSVHNVEMRRPGPDVGRQCLASYFPFRSETGEVVGLIGAVVDITERKLQESRLQESEERFRTIFETVTDAIFVHDMGCAKFVDVNQRAADMFGYTREELLGMNIADLSVNTPPYTQADALERVRLAVAGKARTFEWRCRKKNGTLFWVEIGCRATVFGGGNYLLSTLRDIDQRKSVEEKLTIMAQFDQLTGLANRGVFVMNLEHAITVARRRHSGIAVFYLDVDNFKDVNDTLGHPIGDRLLQSVAQRLRDHVRASDTVARFGGDEFAVLMPDLNEPADAETLAQKLVDAMELPFLVDANEVHTGISIGIAVYEPGMDAEALLSHADVALYRSKTEGRHTYRFFNDAMDLEIRCRVNLVAELREAIAQEQLFLVYQPQVDLDTGRLTGLEALVRWRHPTRGVLSPALFIPTAERTGLIVPLGKWVLAQACRQARVWLDDGIAPARVAINFSALQFKTPGELTKEIDAVLAETGLPAHMLEMELTETMIMETMRDHSGVLEELRKRGVRIAIDDFGTGYSSLTYLRRFPVDRIKLAQEFVVDLATDPSDAVIVRAVIGLARALGADTIAEGVETEQQLALLKSWGCGAAQGFYFAEPLPVEDATRLLRQSKIDETASAARNLPRPGKPLHAARAPSLAGVR